jgi:hypothetical protein
MGKAAESKGHRFVEKREKRGKEPLDTCGQTPPVMK